MTAILKWFEGGAKDDLTDLAEVGAGHRWLWLLQLLPASVGATPAPAAAPCRPATCRHMQPAAAALASPARLLTAGFPPIPRPLSAGVGHSQARPADGAPPAAGGAAAHRGRSGA